MRRKKIKAKRPNNHRTKKPSSREADDWRRMVKAAPVPFGEPKPYDDFDSLFRTCVEVEKEGATLICPFPFGFIRVAPGRMTPYEAANYITGIAADYWERGIVPSADVEFDLDEMSELLCQM